jgi:hypothetical protein
MTRSPQDRLTTAAVTGAMTGALRAWAGGVRQATGALPDPAAVVGGAFDVAEQVLRTQREVALGLVRLTRRSRYPRF